MIFLNKSGSSNIKRTYFFYFFSKSCRDVVTKTFLLVTTKMKTVRFDGYKHTLDWSSESGIKSKVDLEKCIVIQNKEMINIYGALSNNHISGWHVSAWIVWSFLPSLGLHFPPRLPFGVNNRPSPPRSRMSKIPTLGDALGNVSLSIACICPHSPHWGKTFIGALLLKNSPYSYSHYWTGTTL